MCDVGDKGLGQSAALIETGDETVDCIEKPANFTRRCTVDGRQIIRRAQPEVAGDLPQR